MKIAPNQSIAQAIEQSGIVSIIRMDDLALVCRISQALYAGGIRCLEVPMTAPNAVEIVRAVLQELPDDVIVGGGTVLSAEGVRNMHQAGARFVVSPHFVPEVAAACKELEMAFVPGAFSPQEIHHAWTHGADIVKVFSIRPLGAKYLSDLAGPYPEIKLMPTGGINLDNATSFIKAGACAVTVGRDLLGDAPWNEPALAAITNRAQTLVANIQTVRQS